MQTQIVSAAWRAQAILAAINMTDPIRLQRELTGLEAERRHVSDALEAERLELLAGIAQELSRQDGSSDVCRSLLQHTAATAGVAAFRATPSALLLQ